MKDKAVKILLILAVTAIWVAIISRIWSSASSTESVVSAKSVFRDTSSIAALSRYAHLKPRPITRDPFSGEAYEDPKPDTSLKAERPFIVKREEIAVAEKDWSEGIVLTGTGSQPGGKKLAMLSLNGKATILQAGEMSGEIRLNKILDDAVELQLGKKRKIIGIQKR